MTNSNTATKPAGSFSKTDETAKAITLKSETAGPAKEETKADNTNDKK